MSFDTWKPLRLPGGRTNDIRGTQLRFGSIRPRKVLPSAAPPQGYPTAFPVCPVEPYHDTTPFVYEPSMNVDYLRLHVVPAVRRSGDAQLADYLDASYQFGFVTGSSLPANSSRLFAPNRCIPGTPRGQPVTDMLLRMRGQRRLTSALLPRPGTVTLPVNSDFAIKYGQHEPKLKVRDIVDGKHPRRHRNSPGHHSDPRTRNFATTPFFDVMVRIAELDVEAFSAEDFESAFNTLTLHPSCVVRQAIFWTLPGEQPQWHYPSCGLFGGCPTPFMWHLHGLGFQIHLQEECANAVATASGGAARPPFIYRNTDDLLFLYPRGSARYAHHTINTFASISRRANCPHSPTKEIFCSKRVRHDGYLLVAGRFPNPNGHTDVGVGFDSLRCTRIRLKVASAIKGLTRTPALSFLGLAAWAAPILPYSRSLLEGYRRGLHTTPIHDTCVPTASVVKDLQRFMGLFNQETLVPISMLLCLDQPRRVIWTDASGCPTKDGHLPHFGGYDDSATAPFFYHWPVPPELYMSSSASKLEASNSTMYLELIAFWILIWFAATRRWHGRPTGFSIRWMTDSEAGANAWRRQASRKPYCNDLIRLIGHFCSVRRIYVEAVYLPREQNAAADALTHANITQFRALTGIPADRQRDPSSVPLDLVLSLR